MSETERICYVIMPFSATTNTTEDEWNKIYTNLFKPIIEEANLGYVCKRSEIENGAFTKDIVQNLKTARIVLADITDFNPNVMWELGVRHSLSKRTVMVAREDFIPKIPSDIKAYGVIPYVKDITAYREFKDKISSVLQKIEENPEKSDNPVFDFIKEEEIILSAFEKRIIIGKLTGLLTELIFNFDFIKSIKQHPDRMTRFSNRTYKFFTNALADLVTTNYVTLNNIDTSRARVILAQAEYFNVMLDYLNSHEAYKELLDQIEPMFDEYEKNLKECIHPINKILKQVKNESVKYSYPVVVMFNDEYAKLLE